MVIFIKALILSFLGTILFLFLKFLLDKRKIVRAERYLLSNGQDGFSNIVKDYCDKIKSNLEMDYFSYEITPIYFKGRIRLAAKALLIKEDNKTKKAIFISIGEDTLESLNFFDVTRREISNFFGDFDDCSPFEYRSFENFLSAMTSHSRVWNLLNNFSFKTNCVELTYLKDLHCNNSKQKSKVSELEEPYVDFQEEINKTIKNIKRGSTSLTNLANEIDDIDISVSVSELLENSSEILERIDSKRLEETEDTLKFSKEYLDSISSIRKYVRTFKKKKDNKSLSENEELEIQNLIDKEIVKWNDYFRKEA